MFLKLTLWGYGLQSPLKNQLPLTYTQSGTFSERNECEMMPLILLLLGESVWVELLWVGIVLGVTVYLHNRHMDRDSLLYGDACPSENSRLRTLPGLYSSRRVLPQGLCNKWEPFFLFNYKWLNHVSRMTNTIIPKPIMS